MMIGTWGVARRLKKMGRRSDPSPAFVRALGKQFGPVPSVAPAWRFALAPALLLLFVTAAFAGRGRFASLITPSPVHPTTAPQTADGRPQTADPEMDALFQSLFSNNDVMQTLQAAETDPSQDVGGDIQEEAIDTEGILS